MNEFTAELCIPFPNKKVAEGVCFALEVDIEPERSRVRKTLEVEENLLRVKYFGAEARKVRVALTSFFEALIMVLETIQEYGPESINEPDRQ